MGRLNMTRELELGCFSIGFCDAIDSQTLRAMAAVSESATVCVLDDWSQPWNLCYPKKDWQPRDGETFYKAGGNPPAQSGGRAGDSFGGGQVNDRFRQADTHFLR